MDENIKELVKLRQENAHDLLLDAKMLLQNGSYKSANNRAYYAIEKAVKALLITKGVNSEKHSGCLKMFNTHFIHEPGDSNPFTHDDYEMIANAAKIRTNSDYDDFYIASKQDSMEQVKNAEVFLAKVDNYLSGLLGNKGTGNN